MKSVIALTTFNRRYQLEKTLASLEQYKDCQVVIRDDSLDYEGNEKTWVNSSVAFNIAIYDALKHDPDIVIIQNAECFHAGDIIGYAEKHLTDDNYISFGCYSLSENDTLPPKTLWPQGASFDGESAWYNHPVYRHVGYHFCSAITAKNLKKLNGFDERLKDGIGYEDDLFLFQVKSLGLRVEVTSEPFVYHQWHDHSHNHYPELVANNKALFEELTKEKFYRATHLITPDL
jgi:hypothetical protein